MQPKAFIIAILGYMTHCPLLTTFHPQEETEMCARKESAVHFKLAFRNRK